MIYYTAENDTIPTDYSMKPQGKNHNNCILITLQPYGNTFETKINQYFDQNNQKNTKNTQKISKYSYKNIV